MTAPRPIEIEVTNWSTVAWFWPRARTVRLAVFVPVNGMSPSNDASVPAETVETAFITLTATVIDAAMPLVCEFVWLIEVAKTSTAPEGAEKEAFVRTFASVTAPDEISAAPQVTAPAPRPPMLPRPTRSWQRKRARSARRR